MKRFVNNKMFKNYVFIFISIMLVEIIFRLVNKVSIFNVSLIRILIGVNIISLFLSFLLSFINKKKLRTIISFIIIFIISAYAWAQSGFYNFIGVYMSFNTTSQLGAVGDYIREFLLSFNWYYYLIFVPIIIFLGLDIFFFRKKEDQKDEKGDMLFKSILTVLLLGLNICLFSISLNISWMQNELQLVPNKDLFKNPSNPTLTISSFGVTTYGILDVKAIIFQAKDSSEVFGDEDDEEILTITDNSRIIDDTSWNTLISEETNSTYNSINKYLINKTITDKNEYTGLFEGKNVIFIMMESVGEMILNEEYFPNIMKMYNEGISFENNYSPRNSCSTGNNEFSALTSLYSIYNSCTANVYKNNYYSEALFNLFNDKNYTTIGMHDYTEAYYYRSVIFPHMGASAYYGVQKLGIKYSNEYINWASDEDFANAAMDIMLKEKASDRPYMLWMMTVSGHQPYNVDSDLGTLYYNEFSDAEYSSTIKRYLSKIMVTDKAIGILVDRLKEAGELDNTVFVLTGDHYPYGLSYKNINTVLDYDLEDYEAERTPLIIYNSKTEPEKVTSYTTYMDILPTVANLFNLDYDPRYYMGDDVFNPDYQSIVVFADGSWKNERAFYDASNGILKTYSDNLYTTDEIININTKITNDMKISTLIIKNNYFDYLDKKLLEINSRVESEENNESSNS